MENIIEFFLKAGKVKRMKQRGLVLRGVKDPARVGAHSFREALMGWVLVRVGNSGLDSGRIIKITLLRDLCAGYAGDPTPYEPVLAQDKEIDLEQTFKKWVRLSKKEKQKYHDQQVVQMRESLETLVKDLPPSIATEMKKLWEEYEQQLTQEARFVHQLHFLENFIQSLEYWKEDKSFPMDSWWHQMKELISDPLLLELLEKLDEEFYGKNK